MASNGECSDIWELSLRCIKCGNCGELGHGVIQCFKTRDGRTFGCACCNSGDHETIECKDFPDDIQRQIDILVTKRANMPSLATPPWLPILFEAVSEDTTKAHLGPLPWSEDFAEQHSTLKTHRVDPSTKDWQTCKASYFGQELVINALLYAAVWEERAALRRGRCIVSIMRPSKAHKATAAAGERRKELLAKTFDFQETAIWEAGVPGPI